MRLYRWRFWLLLLACLPLPALAAGPFSLEGSTLKVKTDRYEMAFECGSLTYLQNLLTGETYAQPTGELRQRLFSLIQGLTVWPPEAGPEYKQQIDASHPWLGSYSPETRWVYAHHPTARSAVSLRSLSDSHVIVTWKGLEAADPERFFPDETYSLDLEVLPGSGDLALTARGTGAGPGTLGVSFLMANFSRDLDFIWPICEGSHHRPRDLDWRTRCATWPAPWVASLVIAQGRRGAVGMWMADPQLRARYLHLRNNPDCFDVIFESMNAAPFAPWQEAESRPIRLNVYRGSWVLPAKAFRDWWATTFKVKPLVQREPAWLKNIRWAVNWYHPPPPEYGPQTTFTVFQNWKVGPKPGPGVDSGLFPEDMEAGPVLSDAMKQTLPIVVANGSHPIVYLNIRLMNKGHPWAARYWDYRIIPAVALQAWQDPGDPPQPGDPGAYAVHCAARPWQDLIVGWAKQTYERYGITGFYMDCASGEANSARGLIDGKNDVQGQVELMKRIKQEIPGAFLDCEYLNEAMAQVVDFGSVGFDAFWPGSGPGRQKTVHPIIGCLFNDYTYITFIVPDGRFPTFDETMGRLPRWQATPPLPDKSVTDYCRSENFQTFRAHLWCKTLMRPVYPDDWDPRVHAYYVDAAGNQYQVLGDQPDEGRMVKVLPQGKEELVYWRIKSRREAPLTADTGLEGWVAYDGDRAIGLDPTREYLYTAGPRYRDWEVIRLPEQAAIVRSRPYKQGLLVLDLRSLDGQPHTGEVQVLSEYDLVTAITALGGQPLQPEAVLPDGRKRYRLTAPIPGVLALSTEPPLALSLPDDGAPLARLAGTVPRFYCYLTSDGLREPIPGDRLAHVDAARNLLKIRPLWSNDGAIDYLYQLPTVPEGKRLLLRFESLIPYPGNTCELAVGVNGREVLRQALVGKDEQGQAHEIDLTPWAGQSLVLSLYLDKCRFFQWFHLQNPVIVAE